MSIYLALRGSDDKVDAHATESSLRSWTVDRSTLCLMDVAV